MTAEEAQPIEPQARMYGKLRVGACAIAIAAATDQVGIWNTVTTTRQE